MLLSPMTLLLLALVACAAGLRWRRRWAAWAGAALLLLSLASMTPLAANALVGWIESRAVARPGECEGLQAIVFLSGGVQRAPGGAGDLPALTSDTIARAFGFVQRAPRRDLPLVLSGGGPFAVPESAVIATLLQQHGVAADRLVIEPDSRSTWGSALAVRNLLPPGTTRIALASSALHLPRAMLVYRAAGFRTCPWPVHSIWQSVEGPGALWPQSSSLRKTEAAWHELLGSVWYRARLWMQHA